MVNLWFLPYLGSFASKELPLLDSSRLRRKNSKPYEAADGIVDEGYQTEIDGTE